MPSPMHSDCCGLCGRPIARHYDRLHVWIGCMGARRDEQPFTPEERLASLQQSVRELEQAAKAPARSRARRLVDWPLRRWRN